MIRNMNGGRRRGAGARGEVRGPAAELRSLPWTRVRAPQAQWSPSRVAAPPRSGPSELPASGEGGRVPALISLSRCDPPTRRGRRTRQDRTPPTRAQVSLNYHKVALELEIMHFRFMFDLQFQQIEWWSDARCSISHFWLRNVFKVFYLVDIHR